MPVVPARGGVEVALGIYLWPSSSIEFACAARQPCPCVRALCEAVAQVLYKNTTCARPRRNATPSEHFPHTSKCTLHAQHFALNTCTSRSTLHLISNLIEWLGGGSWPWASIEKMALRYGWGVAEVRLSQWYTFEYQLSMRWVYVEYQLSRSWVWAEPTLSLSWGSFFSLSYGWVFYGLRSGWGKSAYSKSLHSIVFMVWVGFEWILSRIWMDFEWGLSGFWVDFEWK